MLEKYWHLWYSLGESYTKNNDLCIFFGGGGFFMENIDLGARNNLLKFPPQTLYFIFCGTF